MWTQSLSFWRPLVRRGQMCRKANRKSQIWPIFNKWRKIYIVHPAQLRSQYAGERDLTSAKNLGLTLILLFTTTPTFANCLSFSFWIWTKTLYDVIWLADSQKWVWLIKLFSRIRVKTPIVFLWPFQGSISVEAPLCLSVLSSSIFSGMVLFTIVQIIFSFSLGSLRPYWLVWKSNNA